MENEIAAEVIRCPACGSATRPWIVSRGFPILACGSCGLKFVYPQPVDTTGLYSADYFFGAQEGFGYVDYDADKLAQEPVLRRYLGLIEKRFPSKGSLLDVGAATGVFVGLARKRGWNAEGVEIAFAAVEAAQKKGLPVRQGKLEAVEGEERYDAISLLDVLEHLPDPSSALVDAFRLLRPGGVLAVNLPDAGSFYARLMGGKWHAIVPPEHLWYFTRQALENMFAKAGFARFSARTMNKSFSLPYILSTAGRWLGWLWLSRFAFKIERSFLGKLIIPLPLNDNLFVIASKPRP